MSIEPTDRKPVAVLAVVSLVLLVAVVVLAVLGAGWHADAQKAKDAERSAQADADQASAEATAGQKALAAARADLVDIGSFSYKTFAKDTAWHDDFSSPEVARPFVANQKALAKAIAASKTVSKAQVTDAMYRAVGPTQVEVMAFVDAARTFVDDHGKRHGVIDKQRATMTMVLVDGDWKIKQVNLLGGEDNS